MAILINRTQNNFTMISNCIFHDQTLSMRDRGVFCMLCSLPDGWEFSIAGLSAISKDGKDSIRASVHVLEEKGYFVRNVHRNESGQFTTEIEIYPAGNTASDLPTRASRQQPRTISARTLPNLHCPSALSLQVSQRALPITIP